jgi:hypothetical protein
MNESAAVDCRTSPWGYMGSGGHCGMGVCVGTADNPEAVWACVCDAGWERFPAVGAAPRCTHNPALQRALCAVTLWCSVSMLLRTARVLRAGGTTLSHNAPIISVCLLCVVANVLQLVDPSGRVLLADFTVSLLKLGAYVLLSDVVIRVAFLRYRTVALATASDKCPSSLLDAEALLRRRTQVEVAAVFLLFAVSFGVGMSGVPTRAAVAAHLAYWVVAPFIVVEFVRRSTGSLIRELIYLRGAMGPEHTERFNFAIAKAVTARFITLVCYVGVILPPLLGLVLLPYSDQCGHWILEVGFLVAMVGTAMNQRAQVKLKRRRVHRLPSAVVRSETVPQRDAIAG